MLEVRPSPERDQAGGGEPAELPDASPAPRPDPGEGPDAGADPAAGPSCEELYGAAPEYLLCSEDPETCTFAARTGGGNCDEMCAAYGGTCIDAFDNVEPDVCTDTGQPDDCTTNRQTEICACSRP